MEQDKPQDSETLDRQKERDELEKILATLVIDAQWREGFFPEDKIQIAKSAIRAYEKRKIEGLMMRGTSNHGNCCTCQECKFAHDDCKCEHNRTILDVLKSLGIE